VASISCATCRRFDCVWCLICMLAVESAGDYPPTERKFAAGMRARKKISIVNSMPLPARLILRLRTLTSGGSSRLGIKAVGRDLLKRRIAIGGTRRVRGSSRVRIRPVVVPSDAYHLRACPTGLTQVVIPCTNNFEPRVYG
jgi:hypothetical protein